MDTLGYNINLEVKLLSFDNKTEIAHKSQTILEKPRELPAKVSSIFMKKEKVACGGFIDISLTAKTSPASTVTFLSECRVIPDKTFFSHVGTIYNNAQKTVQHIKWVGKPLEKILPDACKRINVGCEVAVTTKKELSYRIYLSQWHTYESLFVFKGELLLE